MWMQGKEPTLEDAKELITAIGRTVVNPPLNDVPDITIKPPKNMDVEGGLTKGELLWKD